MHRPHGLRRLWHKWPTFAFTSESGYTLAFRRKIAHKGTHGETGAFWMGAVSLPSDRFARSGNPAWPGGRTANFAPFGSRSRVLPKNVESLRDSDALMRVAVPRRRSPAGLRDLFRFCRNCGFHTLCSRLSACARHRRYHYPRRAPHVLETLDGRLSKGFICRFLRLGGHRWFQRRKMCLTGKSTYDRLQVSKIYHK